MSKNDCSDKIEEEASRALVPVISEETVNFIKAKEDFKKTLNFPGILYRYNRLIIGLSIGIFLISKVQAVYF